MTTLDIESRKTVYQSAWTPKGRIPIHVLKSQIQAEFSSLIESNSKFIDSEIRLFGVLSRPDFYISGVK